ncbi:hypothetical protein [Kribbella solani]|uniref:Uncharacterized protein n=1 Tax=Kribbella solani TaxID=236067 RepID=A0A841E111_9ACTN|nr:hypothetical protein [Kribbella solani]MBB5982695.1 hypothetical protein [Kribbella solani]
MSAASGDEWIWGEEMADGDPYLDRGTRTAIAASMAAGVSNFDRGPGTRVLVIARSSGDEWQRYVRRVGAAFADLDRMTRVLDQGLPGSDRSPGWRSQRAAVDALADANGQYAVVAEVGDDGPLTVVSFVPADGELRVVGGGTTFAPTPPPPPAPKVVVRGVLEDVPRLGAELATHAARLRGERTGDVFLPSGEQAGHAVQYALATLAGRHSLRLVHQVSPDGWHGPRTLQGRRMVLPDGLTLSPMSAAQAWSELDAQDIVAQVTLSQAGRHPYPQVNRYHLGPVVFRRLATELRDWLELRGTVEVYDHGDPDQRFAAHLAVLELEAGGSPDEREPIPDRAGVRTIVAKRKNQPQAAVTLGRQSDGDLRVLRFLRSGHLGADRATELMMFEAAARDGGGLSFSRAAAIRYTKRFASYSMSSEQVARSIYQLREQLGQVDAVQARKMHKRIATLDATGVPSVDPDALADRVQRFREAGGDVLFLNRSDPAFEALQDKVADRMAAAMDPAGAVPADVDNLWRVFTPPGAEPGRPNSGDQYVAVALVDSLPVAAAAARMTNYRCELGALGAVSGADDALVAAVVDGVYEPLTKTRPLTMFVHDAEVPEQLEALGLQVTGVRPLDDESRVEFRLPETTRAAIEIAGRSGWPPASVLDDRAEQLLVFQRMNGSMQWLDHGVAAQRQVAEKAGRDAQDDPGLGPRPESPVPPVHGNRFTVLAQSGNGSAYVTFDETPGGEIEVVDVAIPSLEDAGGTAARYAFCDYLAKREQDAVLHARIPAAARAAGTWDEARSRYFVIGMANRLGDRATEMVRPLSTPAPDAARVSEVGGARAGQADEAGQGNGGGKVAGSGKGEAQRRPDGPDGRGGRRAGPER